MWGELGKEEEHDQSIPCEEFYKGKEKTYRNPQIAKHNTKN